MKKKKVVKKVAEKTRVKALVKECVLTGYTFAKTYSIVKGSFPNTKLSKRYYYWYRRHLHIGKIVALVVEE